MWENEEDEEKGKIKLNDLHKGAFFANVKIFFNKPTEQNTKKNFISHKIRSLIPQSWCLGTKTIPPVSKKSATKFYMCELCMQCMYVQGGEKLFIFGD